MAPRNIGRPQNSDRRSFWTRRYFTCAVSFGGAIGGISWSIEIFTSPPVGRVEVHLHRRAVEVARLRVPVLSFALVHRHLDRVAVRAVERLVAVEQRLHVVVARRDVLQAARRPADDRVVDDRILARLEAVDVDAENRPRAVGAVLIRLRLRLRLAVVGDEEQDAAVERLRAAGGGEGDGEAERPGGLRAGGEDRGTRDNERQREREVSWTDASADPSGDSPTLPLSAPPPAPSRRRFFRPISLLSLPFLPPPSLPPPLRR